ncbi:MAG: gliding motility lipoprotein GldD [Prevotellaceae bacterium]|jgi:gliding motility-associated lipoprotein GldD|nr:gliding motility lipoprotein GldD [Prevotellaceae bacterium]
MKISGLKICIVVVVLVGVLFCSCKGEKYAPKPRGYFRIGLLDKSYQTFDTTYPYKFEYPTYGEVEFLDRPGEQYWMNLNFPHYNATIYLSYKRINNNLPELIEDSHKLSYDHSVKAEAIVDRIFINDSLKVYGMFIEVEGDAASPVQFYVTDSIRNFLRGSLYFYSSANRDSLNPLIEYFEEDIKYLMETLEWKHSK